MSFAFTASFLVTISSRVLGTEGRSATFPAARTSIIDCFTGVNFSTFIRNVLSVTKRYTALKIVQSLRHSGEYFDHYNVKRLHIDKIKRKQCAPLYGKVWDKEKLIPVTD
jgi:hypothetical protein